MAYCEAGDLILGSIPTNSLDAEKYVNDACDEIDSKLGFMYATPIIVDEAPQNRPTRLLLKRLNVWLASGRLIMALDSGGQDDQLHQYALYLVSEATKTLEEILNGEIVLPGVDPSSPDSAGIVTGPQQVNGDEYSLVEAYGSIFGDPAKIALNAPRPFSYSPFVTW